MKKKKSIKEKNEETMKDCLETINERDEDYFDEQIDYDPNNIEAFLFNEECGDR